MQEHRFIIHCDLDAFYASVEQRDQPALRGKPVIVGGSLDRRGVVSTASYEARKYGIRSAMPCRTAQRLCPEAIFLPPRFEVYQSVSQQIMTIFRAHTAVVEPLSLDEAYLDVSSVVHDLEEATDLARTIQREIRDATQLTASAGVSYCKSLAKIASDLHKPDGLTTISWQHAPAFLEKLSIDRFFGVGNVTAARLRHEGIETGADLKRVGEDRLRSLLGTYGTFLFHLACGQDDRPVEPERVRKSVGKEETFVHDLVDRDRMEAILERLATQVEQRLVEVGLRGRTLTLKVKWSTFQLTTRSVSRAQGFQEVQGMMPVLRSLLSQLEDKNRPVRLLGVAVSNLLSPEAVLRATQIRTPSLWEDLSTLDSDFSGVPLDG
jgi:DNA polymerase IV